MNVHHKTVAYRLASAEEALGYPIAGSGIDLAAALLVDLALHGE
jgi:DNA-binding PucR family transcriptional regulator